LDFDIGTTENNVVREFNSPPIFPRATGTLTASRPTRRRRPDLSRRWQIRNTQTGDSYNLIPGPDDGVADAFARADVWILRFKEGEIDDGISATPSQAGASQATAPADINRFNNGESLRNQDVVVWYAAHFTHALHEDDGHGHVVGPVLRPARW
jgi:Cu2+-containing amine oxidase